MSVLPEILRFVIDCTNWFFFKVLFIVSPTWMVWGQSLSSWVSELRSWGRSLPGAVLLREVTTSSQQDASSSHTWLQSIPRKHLTKQMIKMLELNAFPNHSFSVKSTSYNQHYARGLQQKYLLWFYYYRETASMGCKMDNVPNTFFAQSRSLTLTHNQVEWELTCWVEHYAIFC